MLALAKLFSDCSQICPLLKTRHTYSWKWWDTPAIPVLGKLRQEDGESQITLTYAVKGKVQGQ